MYCHLAKMKLVMRFEDEEAFLFPDVISARIPLKHVFCVMASHEVVAV